MEAIHRISASPATQDRAAAGDAGQPGTACSECGRALPAGARFCIWCGIPTEPTAADTAAPLYSRAGAQHHVHHHYHHLIPSQGTASGVPAAESQSSAPRGRAPGSAGGSAGKSTGGRAEAGARQVVQDWAQACNTKHIDDLLALYAARSATLIRSSVPPVRSLPAIREFLVSLLEAGLGDVEMESLRVEAYTVGSGYGDTQSSIDTSGGDSGFSEDKVVSATGTQTATATASTTDTFVNLIVALESSGGLPTVATPTFSPAAGSYGPAQTVTISDATSGVTIYYTTNGSTPTTASSAYSSPITVSATETLKALATHSGDNNSAVASAVYTINGAVATPGFSPAAGAYGPAQSVTISDATSGATIYYTTNGTTPTTASSVYSSAITVSVTEILEALATKASYSNSAVGSAVYTINGAVATPGFSPAAGTYSSAQTVTITDSTSGATIYYTTNGTTPTTASTAYSSAITVSATETLEALATKAGYSNSAVGSAAYTISVTQVATPGFSPAAGTYSSSQSVTISDATSGAAIYFTTNGSTPTTASSVYSSAISVTATETLKAIATHSGDTNSAVGSAVYTISSGSGTCDGMSVGTSVAGTADMNGFVPFQNATGMTTLWNTNIANAAVDPNNAAIQTTAGYSGLNTHVNFGSSPSDGGIPFMIVDSSQTPSMVPIYVYDYASNSDNVVAPYTTTVPIEGAAADCSGWPDTYQSDSHTNVLDRYTCWDYETYNTNRCNGLYDASEEAIWDMQNGEIRPWGWTSTDAAGLSVMAGLVKYDEAASGTIKHAIRMTMQQTKNDANGGYFVEPASHAAGTTYGAPSVEGMRVRLNSSFNISGYSAINQAILTAFQQYGMIVADNGGYFFIQGATDSRWNDSDLSALAGIPSSDFDVIQMTPSYPGYDSATAPTGSAPVISSFTSTATSISSGSSVTFNFSVSGDSYDYIDMIGPVRLTSGSGSVTINPTVTQTYTLYSVNQYGNNCGGSGCGVTVSTPITVKVTGSTLAAPVFTSGGRDLQHFTAGDYAEQHNVSVCDDLLHHERIDANNSLDNVPANSSAHERAERRECGGPQYLRHDDDQGHRCGSWLFIAQRGKLGDVHHQLKPPLA